MLPHPQGVGNLARSPVNAKNNVYLIIVHDDGEKKKFVSYAIMSAHTFLRYFNGTRIIAFESLPAKSGKNEKGVRIYILTPFAVDGKIYREKSLFVIGIALPEELEVGRCSILFPS